MAAQAVGVTPLLVEPEAGGRRAARTLFGVPVVQAVGSALLLADATVAAACRWVCCARPPTSSSCSRNCAERVRSLGRIALLAFVARQSVSDEQPEGNHFPSVDRLTQLVNDAGLRIHAWQSTADVPAIPQD